MGDAQGLERLQAEVFYALRDLDGTIVRNSGHFFETVWGSTEPIPESVEALNRLHATGCVQLIITTSRPESFREITERQLADEAVNIPRDSDILVSKLKHFFEDLTGA